MKYIAKITLLFLAFAFYQSNPISNEELSTYLMQIYSIKPDNNPTHYEEDATGNKILPNNCLTGLKQAFENPSLYPNLSIMPQLNTYHLYTVSSSIFSPAKNLVDFFDKIITLETALTIEQKIREAQTVNLPILNTLLENAQIRQRALEKIEGISTNPPQSLIVHGTPSDLSKQGTDLMQNIGNLISYVNTGENNTNPQLLLQEYQLCLAKSIHYEIQADNLWLYHRILNLSRTNTDEKQTEHLNDTAKKILIMSTICFALVAIGYYLWSTQDILTSSHEVIEKGSNANNEDHPLFVKKP